MIIRYSLFLITITFFLKGTIYRSYYENIFPRLKKLKIKSSEDCLLPIPESDDSPDNTLHLWLAYLFYTILWVYMVTTAIGSFDKDFDDE